MQNKLPLIRTFTKRHPLLTIALSAFIILASIMIILRTRFDTDITRLIPLHAEKTSLYFTLMEKAGGMEKAYIIYSSEHIMDHITVIDKIGSEISASGLVDSVQWKISEQAKAFLRDVYSKKAPLLLSEKEMQDFFERLSPEGMSRELNRTKQRLALPGSPEILAQIDPLNFSAIFSSHTKLSDVSFDLVSGYFLSPDRKKIIMILTPKESPRDITFTGKFIYDIEGILRKYRDDGLRAEITGSHAITLHEASAMKKEIVNNVLMSFISVVLIFLIFFRALRGLLYVMLPVIFSIIATMGIILIFTGSLSEVTGAFAGLIVGLGIDLGIVLYVRYLINSENFTDQTGCMDKSISGVYRGITTGVVTTALTFFPMIFSSFRGVRELGLLTGTGMLICWVFLFGPVSLVIKPSSGKFIELKILRKLSMFAYSKPFVIIFLTAVTTLLLAFFIPAIHVTGDITKLGTDNNRARKALEELKEGYIKDYGVFITDSADSFESALSRSLEIKGAVSGELDNILTAGDILPPAERQEKNLRMLASLDSRRILKDFNKKALETGFKPSAFDQFSHILKEMLENREPLTLKDLRPVQEAVNRLLIKEDNGWSIVVTGNLKVNASLNSLNHLKYTGPSFIRQELLDVLRKDAILISIIGLLLVNIILYVDFKNLYYVFLCQIPVFISIIWVLGIMGLSGISLNFMNAVVFVMLIGIGTDYTVHLLHRYLSDRDIGATFLQTGKAVLVAGLTTIAGFGSIGFSSYRGLATMGQVAVMGTLFCVILSLCLIPSLLRLHEK